MTLADEGAAAPSPDTNATAPNNAGAEPETPENDEPLAEAGDGEGPAEGEQDPQSAEEFDIIEFDGQQYQVPKKLKPGFMMQDDYTRKTQAVADQKRAVEAEQASHRQQAESLNANFQQRVEIAQLDNALQQYAGINWQELELRDPIQAQSLFRQYSQIRDARTAAAQQLQNAERTRLEGVTQQTSRRLQETRAVAQRDIKGWTPEVDAKVTAFARSFGLTDQELINVIDPRTYKLLHLAWLGSQLAQNAAPNTRPKPNGGTEIKPLRQVGQARSKVPASGLSDSLSDDDWVKRRNEQVRKKAGR